VVDVEIRIETNFKNKKVVYKAYTMHTQEKYNLYMNPNARIDKEWRR
jgi:hypothetical protein